MLHLEIDKRIAEKHANGALDEGVISALLPDGKPHDFESFLFDYKAFMGQDNATPVADRVDGLIKDFASFYNSMGGYIVSIFSADAADSALYEILADNDNLNQRIAAYLGANIGVRAYSRTMLVEGVDRRVLVAYVPKRPLNEKPRPFVKNSSNIGSQDRPKYQLPKGVIYCRYEHECKPANHDIELLNFLFSDRDWKPDFKVNIKTENNLPPKDPNLIQFVGRKNSIELLWHWIGEPRRPIKVLTAAGGVGQDVDCV